VLRASAVCVSAAREGRPAPQRQTVAPPSVRAHLAVSHLFGRIDTRAQERGRPSGATEPQAETERAASFFPRLRGWYSWSAPRRLAPTALSLERALPSLFPSAPVSVPPVSLELNASEGVSSPSLSGISDLGTGHFDAQPCMLQASWSDKSFANPGREMAWWRWNHG
jgi:hypothetical protein